MKLRTKLILAFLLLAVVPLAGMTLYAYRSSIQAFRQAVEAEAANLTDEMGERMERVTADLGHRINRLETLPYDTLLAAHGGAGDDVSVADAPTQFLSIVRDELGDAAPLLSALEYVPTDSSEDEPYVFHFNHVLGTDDEERFDLETSRVIRAGREFIVMPSRVTEAGDDPEVFIQVMSDALENLQVIGDGDFGAMIATIAENALEEAIEVENASGVRIEGLGDALKALIASTDSTNITIDTERIADEELAARVVEVERRAEDEQRAQRKAAERMAIVFEETSERVTRAYRQRQEAPAPAATQARVSPERPPRPPRPPQSRWQFDREFTTQVRRNGETVGRLNAHIDGEEVLRTVLTSTEREQGEVPFAVTADGTVHASSPADRAKLNQLEAAGLIGASAPAHSASNDNWVIVKRQVPGTDTTFGIARPIGERMESIRSTAGRNMAWGLGLVGLAMLGIVPLSGRMTRNLSALSDGAAEMARGNLDVRVPVRSGDEFGELARVFNSMGASLKQQQEDRVEQERLRKELEMGRQIQDEMLPAGRSNLAMADLRAVSIPAREVGGDFFNYFELDDGSIALIMGDVSGKGVAAALLMANLQATLRARLPMAGDLAQLARSLDHELEAGTPARSYVTLFMGVLDQDRRVLRYVNAGHNTQYVVHSDGRLSPLASSGRPLGLLAGGNFVEEAISVAANDSVFLFTDGLVESEDDTGDPYGEERLEGLLTESREKDPDGLLEHVEATVQQHRGTMEAADDATILVLRLR